MTKSEEYGYIAIVLFLLGFGLVDAAFYLWFGVAAGIAATGVEFILLAALAVSMGDKAK